MNEVPKCPGCGSEMKAVDFGREHLNFSFFCYECGWGSPLRDTAEEALSAALHRYEPENRPMSLEEISENVYNEDWAFVWLETKGAIFPLQLCPWDVDGGVLGFCWPLSEDEFEAKVEEIGKTWRCWPRKPTPEQMAAEKWEE